MRTLHAPAAERNHRPAAARPDLSPPARKGKPRFVKVTNARCPRASCGGPVHFDRETKVVVCRRCQPAAVPAPAPSAAVIIRFFLSGTGRAVMAAVAVGPTTPKAVMRATGLDRTRVYDVPADLRARGLVADDGNREVTLTAAGVSLWPLLEAAGLTLAAEGGAA